MRRGGAGVVVTADGMLHSMLLQLAWDPWMGSTRLVKRFGIRDPSNSNSSTRFFCEANLGGGWDDQLIGIVVEEDDQKEARSLQCLVQLHVVSARHLQGLGTGNGFSDDQRKARMLSDMCNLQEQNTPRAFGKGGVRGEPARAHHVRAD
jgi:hypothetical protein